MNIIKTLFFVILILFVGSSIQELNAQRQLINSISSDVKTEKLKKNTKIIVSDRLIDAADPADINSKETFSVNDDMYARVFFPIQLRKISKKQINIDAIVESTGERYELAYFNLTTADEFSTYIDLNLKDDLYLGYFQKLFLQLDKGENLIRLVVSMGIGHTATKISECEITLVKNESENLLIGKTFNDFEAGITNPELEAQILEFFTEYSKKNGWHEEAKDIKIKSKDWTVNNHKYSGAVVSRSIAVWVYAVWPDGHCSVQGFDIKQKFDGSGFSDQLLYDGVAVSQKQVDCK